MTPPVGLAAIRQVYGDISVAGGKIVTPLGWESANMVILTDLPLVPHKLYIHKLMADPLRAAHQTRRRAILFDSAHAEAGKHCDE